MNRFLIVLITIMLLVGGIFYWQSKQSSTPPDMKHQVLSEDLYPLYNGTSWNASGDESFAIGNTTFSGASIKSATIADTMDPGSIFTPFESYYDQKLKALGWQTTNDLAAGGHVGGQTGYRKNASIILTRFQIVYHSVPDNAPSECPCDVTLSLFSSEN